MSALSWRPENQSHKGIPPPHYHAGVGPGSGQRGPGSRVVRSGILRHTIRQSLKCPLEAHVLPPSDSAGIAWPGASVFGMGTKRGLNNTQPLSCRSELLLLPRRTSIFTVWLSELVKTPESRPQVTLPHSLIHSTNACGVFTCVLGT